MADTAEQPGDPIDELIAAERRARRETRVWTGLCALMTIFLSVVPFSSGGRIPNIILGSIMAACTLGLLYEQRGGPLRKPALAALVRRPKDVVWLYVMEARPRRETSFLMVGLIDGTTWPASLPPGRRSEILPALALRFPHATTGYDLDLEERFRSNPASLRMKAP